MADSSFFETHTTFYDKQVMLVMTDWILQASSLQEGLLSREQRMEMIRRVSAINATTFRSLW